MILGMCEMLMDHGARVDGQSLENYYTSQLYQKVKHGEIGKASLLVSWGSRLDELMTRSLTLSSEQP